MPDEKQQQRTRVLITGFGAFPDTPENPSETLVKALSAAFADHAEIELRGLILSTAFNSCCAELRQEIDRFAPDLVLAFGVRANGKGFDLESVARNRLGKRKDAQGVTGKPGPIDPHGTPALHASLPLRGLRAALQDAGIPVRVSKSAGSYVCNYLFYNLMQEHGARMAGFIHIPHSEESAQRYTGKKQPSPLPQATLQKGAALIIETAVRHHRREP